jgi:hypothetical protein
MKGLFLSKSRAGAVLWLVLAFGMMCAVSGTGQAQDSEAPARNAPAAEKVVLGVQLVDEELVVDIVDRSVGKVLPIVSESINTNLQNMVIFASVAITVVIAGLGFFGFNSVRNTIGNEIERYMKGESFKSSLKDNVTKGMEGRLKEIEMQILFYHWTNKAKQMKEADSIKRGERDEALGMLRELARSSEIVQHESFSSALEDFVDTLAAADQVGALEEIDDDAILRGVIQDAPGIMQTYIQHYGMRVLGDAEVSEGLRKRFRTYCDLLKNGNYYELALPYMMVYAHAFEGDAGREKIDEYIRDASLLQPNERGVVARVILKHQDESNVARRTTGQVKRLCDRFRAFFAAYKDRLESDVFPPKDEDPNPTPEATPEA